MNVNWFNEPLQTKAISGCIFYFTYPALLQIHSSQSIAYLCACALREVEGARGSDKWKSKKWKGVRAKWHEK